MVALSLAAGVLGTTLPTAAAADALAVQPLSVSLRVPKVQVTRAANFDWLAKRRGSESHLGLDGALAGPDRPGQLDLLARRVRQEIPLLLELTYSVTRKFSRQSGRPRLFGQGCTSRWLK